MFKNRSEAGRMLVEKLRAYASQAPVLLAVNRGGVAVAQPLARLLHSPLDVVLTRPVYGDGGLSVGSLATGGGASFDDPLVRALGLDQARMAEPIAVARHALEAPAAALRGDRPFPDVARRVVIVVGDGLGPVHDVLAAVRSVRARQPRWLAVAAPFFTLEAARRLLAEVDVVTSLTISEPTGSIYEELHHPDDAETHLLLIRSRAAAAEQERLYHASEIDE